MSTRATTRSQAKGSGSSRKSEAWIPPATAPIDGRQALPILAIGTTLLAASAFAFHKFHHLLIRVPRLNQVNDRLVYALQLETFAMLPLFISLVSVMCSRLYHGAFNPLRSDEHKFVVYSRILTNTVEHTLLFIVNHLILATLVAPDQLSLVVLATFLWTLGRVLFFIGYSIHPKYRSIGFLMSYLPTTWIFLWNLCHVSGLHKLSPVSALPRSGDL